MRERSNSTKAKANTRSNGDKISIIIKSSSEPYRVLKKCSGHTALKDRIFNNEDESIECTKDRTPT